MSSGDVRGVPSPDEVARGERFPLGAAITLEELAGAPHGLLADLREREPVSWLPVLGGWLVTRRDLALRVMRDADAFTVDDPRFSTGQVVGPSMLNLDGDEHDRHRMPFARAFRRDAVGARFAGSVAEDADRLIDTIAPQGAAELCRSFAGPLAATVVMDALGLSGVDPAAVLGWYAEIVASVGELTAGRAATAAGRRAFADLTAAIEAALDDSPSSLLGAVTRAEGDLTPAEVGSNAAVLLFGGIETTEGMIANAVLHLLRHPDQLALALAERQQLMNAVEESLRLEPAAALVDRYATGDLTLGASDIRSRELVSVSVAAANRDPSVFADPDRFDTARANARQHIAFAHGPHVCIGMHLARLEAHTALERLFTRLPALRLDPDQPAAPRGLVFRKPPALHVTWAA